MMGGGGGQQELRVNRTPAVADRMSHLQLYLRVSPPEPLTQAGRTHTPPPPPPHKNRATARGRGPEVLKEMTPLTGKCA